jgi:hypothetical protein
VTNPTHPRTRSACGNNFAGRQARDLVRIDQLSPEYPVQYVAMKVSQKQALSIRCPTCGAKPGEKCELSTGLPRTDPHRDRRLAASDK